MPPEAAVLRDLGAEAVVVFRCLTVLPPLLRGATAFDGDRLEDPTAVELGEAG